MSINTLNITKQWRDRRNVLLLLVTCVTIPGFPCHRESSNACALDKKLDFHKFAPCKYVTKLLKPRSKSAKV